MDRFGVRPVSLSLLIATIVGAMASGLATGHGVPGHTVGLGSLLKIHFADRPIRDYRIGLSDR